MLIRLRLVIQVIWAGLGGSEAGNGIRDVLYGDYNPSGRLPYTIARNASDYPAQLVLDTWTPNYPIVIPYTEGYVLRVIRVTRLLTKHR